MKIESNVMTKYFLRLDDICPNMHWQNFNQLIAVLQKHSIKALLSVVPNNQDAKLLQFPCNEKFWSIIQSLNQQGFEIGVHGYNHVYCTKNSGLLGIKKDSEFAGLTFDEQHQKIMKAIAIFHAQKIFPKVFVAPSHSFDVSTLKALEQNNIQIIADGYGILPYTQKGFTFIPHYNNPLLPSMGIQTLDVHLNTISQKNLDALFQLIERHNHQFVDIEYCLKAVNNNMFNRFFKINNFTSAKLLHQLAAKK